jgi:serine/threonine protein kinase
MYDIKSSDNKSNIQLYEIKQQLQLPSKTEICFSITNAIKIYKNSKDNKCINEFEICKKISRGLVWKVYLVRRYFYDSNDNICSEIYALKKTHIKTQKCHRYYLNDILVTYYDKVLEEIKIYSFLSNESQYVIKIYEIIYDPSHEYLYIITELGDLGSLMIKHPINFEYHHNYEIVNYFAINNGIILDDKQEIKKFEINNITFVEKNSLNFDIKYRLSQLVFYQIFQGLKFLHDKRVVHLDIKPENFVFNHSDGCLKFIDFSISKILPEKIIEINDPVGSIHFSSPDVYDYENKKGYYNPMKNDLWSVGICLYLFIFEQFPFHSDSELELQLKITNESLSFPWTIDSPYYKIIQDLISRLLTKNIKERITDIDEILQHELFIVK